MLSNLYDFLLHVPPVSDADEFRRRKLLNGTLIVIAVLTAVAWWVTFSDFSTAQIFSGKAIVEIQNLGGASLLISLKIISIAVIIVWPINRLQIPGWVPAFVFVGLITIACVFSDDPIQLSDGRSLLVWVFPITLAPLSCLLGPLFRSPD